MCKISYILSFSLISLLRNKSECEYELTAVLLHLGSSASAGHYIAHIQDEVTKQWWKFDDRRVTELYSKEVGDIEPTVGSDNITGTREKAKSLISGLKKNPKVTSANAYMLIYSRKGNRTVTEPVPPSEAAKYVEQGNIILMEKLANWQTRQSELRGAIESHQEAYKEFMKLSTLVSNQPYNWIDSKWLASWIIGESKSSIDNTGILCPHDLVDPRKMYRLKIINAKGWDFLAKRVGVIGPVLDGSSPCFDCAAEIYESM